jgi:hypothetical protein
MRGSVRPHALLALVATMVLMLAPGVARADAASDAKDLFTRGRELRTSGDCAGAILLFQKAHDLYPAGLGSLRNIAECEVSLGHYASARRAWLDLKRALVGNQDHKYDGWPEDADQEASRLAPKVATLSVDLSASGPGGQPAPADGVDITVNGEALAPGLVGTPLERDPGKYVVRAAGARVAAPQEETVVLAPGDTKRAALRIVILPAPAPSQAPASALAPATVPRTEASRARRTATWAAFGVGAVGLVGAGVSFLVRQGALDTLHNSCQDQNGSLQCPNNQPNLPSAADTGSTASTLANVFGAVAIVGIATGVVLLATSHPRSSGTALMLSPTGVSAVGRF